MDLVVAGTEAAVLMVESEAQQLSEEIMLGAVVFGHEQGQRGHQRHPRTGARCWQARVAVGSPAKDEALIAKVVALADDKLRAAYQIRNKQARTQACREAYAAVMAGLKADGVEFDSVKVEGMLFDIEAGIVRSQILAGEPHRRPRHPHRAPHRNPQQRAAPRPRFGPVHAWRNPGAGRDHAGHRA